MSMQRGPIVMSLASFAALVLLGCGAGGPSTDDAGGQAAATESPVDMATAATVTGRVNFEGTAPPPEPIDMSEEPTCLAKHPAGPVREQVIVNDNATLRNVFVYVKEGLGDLRFPTPQEPVVLDQDGCVYKPHVLGVQAGQPLVLKNSDGLLHNINAKPTINRSFNISQPTNMEMTRTFGTPEIMIPVECDVHGWMRAYIGVLGHPYHAATGADGTFTLSGLPPGDYVIEAWHERYGTQTMNVTVGAQETREIEFTYAETMAAGAVVPLGEPLRLGGHDAHAGHAPGAAPAGR